MVLVAGIDRGLGQPFFEGVVTGWVRGWLGIYDARTSRWPTARRWRGRWRRGCVAGDPASHDSCVWYHRMWQYLRLLGIITSIRTNTPFLLATFERLADTHPAC